MIDNKTAIYISHRLSSCRFCDDITVFDGGRIVQKGKHEELVKERDGQYFTLWNTRHIIIKAIDGDDRKSLHIKIVRLINNIVIAWKLLYNFENDLTMPERNML